MYVINAPTAAVQKMMERGFIICRAFDRSVDGTITGAYRLITIPIERILVMQKNMFSILNMDMQIPIFTHSTGFAYLDNDTVAILTASLDYIEPQKYGNVFATIGVKSGLSPDEYSFMLKLSKDIIERLPMTNGYDRNMTYSTQLTCVPDSAVHGNVKIDKSVLETDDPGAVLMASTKPIELQEIVKKVDPQFIKDHTSFGGPRRSNCLYDELAEERRANLLAVMQNQIKKKADEYMNPLVQKRLTSDDD